MSFQNISLKSTNKYGYISSKPLFNSKLYIDLDINIEKDDLDSGSENNTEGSDTSFEAEEINCLSNELIEELDNNSESPIDKEKDNKSNNIKGGHNIIDSLLSLANNGYEFKPKNFNPSFPNNQSNISTIYANRITQNNKYLLTKVNSTKNKNNNARREQKQDWICAFCNNLNFSFRTKSNRCKIKKEESDKRKNILISFGL
jgi:hypothetical protein